MHIFPKKITAPIKHTKEIKTFRAQVPRKIAIERLI
jgi:hypothetical protein